MNYNTCTMATTTQIMIAETSFMDEKRLYQMEELKHEAIDRLDSIGDELPKYRKQIEALITHFTVDDMLRLINTIFRDNEFKNSAYYKVYNGYFDEIEELIHKYF